MQDYEKNALSSVREKEIKIESDYNRPISGSNVPENRNSDVAAPLSYTQVIEPNGYVARLIPIVSVFSPENMYVQRDSRIILLYETILSYFLFSAILLGVGMVGLVKVAFIAAAISWVFNYIRASVVSFIRSNVIKPGYREKTKLGVHLMRAILILATYVAPAAGIATRIPFTVSIVNWISYIGIAMAIDLGADILACGCASTANQLFSVFAKRGFYFNTK